MGGYEFVYMTNKGFQKVPTFLLNDENMESTLLPYCWYQQHDNIEYRYINPFPGLQSRQNFQTIFNTKTKELWIVIGYQTSLGIDVDDINRTFRNLNKDHMKKYFNDDEWWDKIKKYGVELNNYYKSYNEFNETICKNIGCEKDKQDYKFIHENYKKISTISIIDKNVNEMLNKMMYIEGYRIAEDKNIILMQIEDSLYYILYDTKTKKDMGIISKGYREGYYYTNYKNKNYKLCLELLSLDDWWVTMKAFYLENKRLHDARRQLVPKIDGSCIQN